MTVAFAPSIAGRTTLRPLMSYRAALLLLALGLLFGVAGCRRPDPVYDRVPRPIGTRDLVRAERRARIELTAPIGAEEWRSIWALHDSYLEAFDALRAAELVPFAAQIRDADLEGLRNDPRRLRSLVSRHLSIVHSIQSMDESFCTDLAALVGEARTGLAERLRARRAIDRASALSIGDGGRPLLDLRQLVDRIDLGDAEWAAAEPILSEFDTQAASLANLIAEEQANLPIAHLSVLDRRGAPADSLDPSLRGDARKQALDRAELERFAESRKELEVLLERYADLVDRSVEGLSAALGDAAAATLRRRLMQSRLDDDGARLGDPSAFQALVAANALRVPKETRERIEILRQEFLAQDERRLREILEEQRSSHQPGVFDPGGAKLTPVKRKARTERGAALVKARTAAAVQFRDQVMNLVGPEMAAEIEALREKSRDEFVSSLAELVGAGRVPMLVQMRPRGFGDREAVDPRFGQAERDGGPQDSGELRLVLPPPPDARAIDALLSRSGVTAPSRAVVGQVASEWRAGWDSKREPARLRMRTAMGPIMEAMNAADKRALDTAVLRMLSIVDELRSERVALDADLLASIDAAAAGEITPAARDLWTWEREEANARLRWEDLPFDEVLRIPSESQLAFLELLRRLPVPEQELPQRTALIAAALAPFAEELSRATEAMRDEALTAVRKAVAVALDARVKGVSESEALSPSGPEAQRIVASVRAAAARLSELRLQALDAVVAAIPVEEGRALREQFVRAAYPRLLDERRGVDAALARLRIDPLLVGTATESDGSTASRAWLDRIIERRGERRDEALGRLLAWAKGFRASERPGREQMGNRDVTLRRHPQLAAVIFDREEADARALREAMFLLDQETLLRHREIAEYFNDPPASGRWLN